MNEFSNFLSKLGNLLSKLENKFSYVGFFVLILVRTLRDLTSMISVIEVKFNTLLESSNIALKPKGGSPAKPPSSRFPKEEMRKPPPKDRERDQRSPVSPEFREHDPNRSNPRFFNPPRDISSPNANKSNSSPTRSSQQYIPKRELPRNARTSNDPPYERSPQRKQNFQRETKSNFNEPKQ